MNDSNRRKRAYDPFHVNSKYKSYLIPAIKIAAALAVIIAAITWTSFWRPDDRRIERRYPLQGLWFHLYARL